MDPNLDFKSNRTQPAFDPHSAPQSDSDSKESRSQEGLTGNLKSRIAENVILILRDIEICFSTPLSSNFTSPSLRFHLGELRTQPVPEGR